MFSNSFPLKIFGKVLIEGLKDHFTTLTILFLRLLVYTSVTTKLEFSRTFLLNHVYILRFCNCGKSLNKKSKHPSFFYYSNLARDNYNVSDLRQFHHSTTCLDPNQK